MSVLKLGYTTALCHSPSKVGEKQNRYLIMKIRDHSIDRLKDDVFEESTCVLLNLSEDKA